MQQQYKDNFKTLCLGGCKGIHLIFHMVRVVNVTNNMSVLLCHNCFNEAPEYIMEILPSLQPMELKPVSLN